MELLNYLLKVSVCSALFFAFYLLVLRRLTFFRINRFYLLISLLISFVIPATQITIERAAQPVVFGSHIGVIQNVKSGSRAFTSAHLPLRGTINWRELLPIFYQLMVAALLCFALWKLAQLFRHTKSSTNKINGLKIVPKEKGFTNCSFFNYVFIDETSLTKEELTVLLAHEEVHAKQLHSLDKIIMIMLKAVLWFNPVIYLFDKALEEAHEYDADETTSKNVGAETYAYLLLKLAVMKSDMPLVHNFVKSPIKQRIKMLFNSKSRKMNKLVYSLTIPLGLLLIWGFTINIVYATPDFGPQKLTQISNHQEEASASPLSVEVDNETQVVETQDSSKTVDPQKDLKGVLQMAIRSIQSETIKPIISQKSGGEKQNKINGKQVYERYPAEGENGLLYDIVKVSLNSGSYASVTVKRNSKVAIYIQGVLYSENEMKAIQPDRIKGITSISAADDYDYMKKTYPSLADKYDGVIHLPSSIPMPE